MSDDLDTGYLTGWARQLQAAAETSDNRGGPRCPHCPDHPWHGFPCPVQIRTGPTWGPCPCASSADGAA